MEERATRLKQNAPVSLWAEALYALPDSEKVERDLVQLVVEREYGEPNSPTISSVVGEAIKVCESDGYTNFTNRLGQTVLTRELINKTNGWIVRFEELEDAAIQAEAGLADIPWAIVKALMQIPVKDAHAFGTLMESIEAISSVITRYFELETRVLIRTSILTKQLSTALVKLYQACLKFLALVYQHYRSELFGNNTILDPLWLQIDKYESDVFKLVLRVQKDISGVSLGRLVKDIKQSIDSSRATKEERCRRLSDWINGIDSKKTYEAAVEHRHEGTGNWVLTIPAFLAWSAKHESDPNTPGNTPGSINLDKPRLLWINGPAGFGKTFLAARIIQSLRESKGAPLSYFFSVSDHLLTCEPYAILRSWLAQLLEQDDRAMLIMEEMYHRRDSEQAPTQSELWQLFIQIGTVIRDCTFVVDGFDECIDIDAELDAETHRRRRRRRSSPRALFLREMLRALSQTGSRVLVVSRNLPDISEYLDPNSPHGSEKLERFEHQITARDTVEDILQFSEVVVNNKLSRKKSALGHKIAKEAAQRSEGMFLWIKILEQEIFPGQDEQQLAKSILEMPSGIGKAYSRELEKISKLPGQDREQAIMILRWVLFAVRPLKVKELLEALLVSRDELEEYPAGDLPDNWEEGFVSEDYVQREILQKCGSLIQLRSQSPVVSLEDHTVHLVHFSVKDYMAKLAKEGSSMSPWLGQIDFEDPMAEETQLSNICLRYLTLDVFKKLPSKIDRYPFLSYASWAWYFHGYHDKPTPPDEIIQLTRRAFDPEALFWRVWGPLMEAKLIDSSKQTWGSEVDATGSQRVPDIGSRAEDYSLTKIAPNPIYYASLLSLTSILQWLLDQGLNESIQGGYYGSPLQAAVAKNNIEAVKILLDRSNVDPSQKGGFYGSSLTAAACLSSPDIVQALLEAGADVNGADGMGWTALHHAVRRGDEVTIRLLLDHKADVNSMTSLYMTPAMLSCTLGSVKILACLIEYGADLHLSNDGALHEALVNNKSEVVELLLSKGCDPNALLKEGWRPLHVVADDHVLASRLLGAGANPALTDARYWTALHYAASYGNVENIEAFIEAGVDASGNWKDDGDTSFALHTPFQLAVINNHLKAISTLHSHGAALDAKSNGGFTALLFAIQNQSREAVSLLFDLGAHPDCIGEYTKNSPFDVALELDDWGMMELLVLRQCFRSLEAVEQGIEEKANDASLVKLSFEGDLAAIHDLLRKMQPSPYIIEQALRVATARGNLPIVKLLLEQGPRMHDRDWTGRTALHIATRHLYFDIAECLIASGASLSLEDIIGSTPLDLATSRGGKARKFLKKHFDSLARSITEDDWYVTRKSARCDVTSAQTREALSGSWSGYYDYLSWRKGQADPFALEIPPPEPGSTHFFSSGQDLVGKYSFQGFVDDTANVWFLKLYKEHGWLYRGRLDVESKILKGTWGSNRKLWSGTFQLVQQEVALATS